MSLTTKKILLSIVSFALALSVAFAVVSFVQNGSKPAFAETGKTVVEWTAGTPNGKDFVDNGDGTYTYTFNLTSSQATLTGSATITPTVQ